jgi:hypothetical protein
MSEKTTSSDALSHRPTKRRALTPVSQQSASVSALFAHPERPITVPTGPKPKTLPAPPELVANVQGSSAGAGSGEFHVYKASRRREYERLRLMDEEVRQEEADRAFEEKRDERRVADEKKTNKNRARRQKAAAAKKGRKAGEAGLAAAAAAAGPEKKVRPNPAIRRDGEKGDGGEEDVVDGGGEVQAADEGGITFHDEE